MVVDLADKIVTYENDEMTDDEEIEFFQYLINTGHAWKLQGHYGRTAQLLISRRLCAPAKGDPDPHLGCPAYPNCDIDSIGCRLEQGNDVEWYGHRD